VTWIIVEVAKWFICLLLAGSTLAFIVLFLLSSRRISQELRKARQALEQIKQRGHESISDLDEIEREAMNGGNLVHLWREYKETLHPQKELGEYGQEHIVCWRATATAETFFTEQAIVNTPLKADFFKHLPGILTGLGIIGTFSGLIFGLMNFHVSEDPNAVRAALATLIQSVGHAFIVSAAAITLAIVITAIEKWQVTARYKEVEKLCQVIDSLFDAGAGEEYLARLVKASEMSATQAAQIKDSLVTDLKEILSELTARQIEAATHNSSQLSSELVNAIASSIKEPMDRISRASEGVRGDQSEAVNRMLTDVLANFSAQMRDIFGGQLQGMNDLLVQTSQTLQATAIRFDQLAGNIGEAGENASNMMAERLNEAVASMEARQQILNRQMGEFVEQIRAMVVESQSESSRKLHETLNNLGEQVADVVGKLQQQAMESASIQETNNRAFVEQTNHAVSNISGKIEELISQSVVVNKLLSESVSTLAGATTSAITGLNSGVETLYIAASDFAKAGQGVADTLHASGAATERIQNASQLLAGSSAIVQKVMEDYGRTRDSFVLIIAELKSTIENAKREASMTANLVGQLQAASNQLGTAQQRAEQYLKSVNEVLAGTHATFAREISRTLHQGNAQFKKEIDEAVGLLKGAITDLADTLDDIPKKR
jgi:hypothetical protein